MHDNLLNAWLEFETVFIYWSLIIYLKIFSFCLVFALLRDLSRFRIRFCIPWAKLSPESIYFVNVPSAVYISCPCSQQYSASLLLLSHSFFPVMRLLQSDRQHWLWFKSPAGLYGLQALTFPPSNGLASYENANWTLLIIF